MSNKLYPPQIEGALPAFYDLAKLVIPFNMNKTVSFNQIQGFALKIKSIQDNSVLYSLTNCISFTENSVTFSLENSNVLTSGQFYKVQIAYIHIDNTVGYYSTVGIIKYTNKPIIYIEGAESNDFYLIDNEVIGVYSQTEITEKVYSYQFIIYDENKQIYETSGELLHNHENDIDPNISYDRYTIKKEIKENKKYYIQYSVTTTNGLIVKSNQYSLYNTNAISINSELKAELIAQINNENGYVDIRLQGKLDSNNKEIITTGLYKLSRASSEDNFSSWIDIQNFGFYLEEPSKKKYRDFTIQHGFAYKYAIQQYSTKHNIISNKIESNEVDANFEHSFLYDGERQLKIKYNPKVTSFKENILEQRTNTMGGQYPFFFRNGNVRYKEFPISGLISYQSDEEELFLTEEEMLLENIDSLKRRHTLKPNITSETKNYFDTIYNYDTIGKNVQLEYQNRETKGSNENRIINQRTRTTQLVDYNIIAERIFKFKVLEFLNDGKPKLFRSPTEGNYIVRLTNSSLSPDDKLSRMLHTFSTTAVEIDSYDSQNLKKYDFLPITEPDLTNLYWETIDIREFISKNDWSETNKWKSIPNAEILSIQCLDMMPGDRIRINNEEIIIGVTGAYFVQFDYPMQVQIYKNTTQGQITIGYKKYPTTKFDSYNQILNKDIPIRQFIGDSNGQDIGDQLRDIKHQVIRYYFMNFTKRPVVTLIANIIEDIIKDDQSIDYTLQYSLGDQILSDKERGDLDPLCLYKIENPKEAKAFLYFDGQNELPDTFNDLINQSSTEYKTKIYFDCKKNNEGKYDITTGEEIDIRDSNDFQLSHLDTVPVIIMTNGVIGDISVQYREIIYNYEKDDENIKQLKDEYLICEDILHYLISGCQSDDNNYTITKQFYNKLLCNHKYRLFLDKWLLQYSSDLINNTILEQLIVNQNFSNNNQMNYTKYYEQLLKQSEYYYKELANILKNKDDNYKSFDNYFKTIPNSKNRLLYQYTTMLIETYNNIYKEIDNINSNDFVKILFEDHEDYDGYENLVKIARQDLEEKYNEFLKALEQKIQEENTKGGVVQE